MITLQWQGDFVFEGRAGGAVTTIDGDEKAGPSPVSLLLESVGACTAIDVVDILRKGRQEVEGLVVEVSGQRRSELPRYVKKLEMRFKIRGAVDPAKAQRAVDLSLEKYCSVFHSLRLDVALDVDVDVAS